MNPEHKLLYSLLERFLGQRQFISDDESFAPVSGEEMGLLQAIIEGLIRTKYAPNIENEYPIDFMFVNRNEGNFILNDQINFMPYMLENTAESMIALLVALRDVTNLLNAVMETEDIAIVSQKTLLTELKKEEDKEKDDNS